MENSKKRRLVATFPWRALRAPLSNEQRALLRNGLKGLLQWQKTLGAFPRLSWAPDATPFVSLYAGGNLRGCYGSDEGSPVERLCRAFLRALEDNRFGTISSNERSQLDVQLSYPIEPEAHDPLRIASRLEPGTHGVACVREGTFPVCLLPQVARDRGSDAAAFLAELSRKAGVARAKLEDAHLCLFRTDDVVARPDRALSPFGEPCDEAAAWLAGIVDPDGRIDFAVDPRARERTASGLMLHGRAAVALRALVASGRHARAANRARAWLAKEIAKALRGASVEGWPDDPAHVAGTLALAQQVGLDLGKPLAAYAERPELRAHPWHAAQVVSALGQQAPARLFGACAADLTKRPWAPWTLLAARARNDKKVAARCERPLVEALRSGPPHLGGAGVTSVPETALTAVSIEALAGLTSRSAVNAVERGRAFLRRWQFRAEVPAALDPGLCRGAFPASPVASLLRCDVTGHALLALLGE